jgi:hypothetical protein
MAVSLTFLLTSCTDTSNPVSPINRDARLISEWNYTSRIFHDSLYFYSTDSLNARHLDSAVIWTYTIMNVDSEAVRNFLDDSTVIDSHTVQVYEMVMITETIMVYINGDSVKTPVVRHESQYTHDSLAMRTMKYYLDGGDGMTIVRPNEPDTNASKTTEYTYRIQAHTLFLVRSRIGEWSPSLPCLPDLSRACSACPNITRVPLTEHVIYVRK